MKKIFILIMFFAVFKVQYSQVSEQWTSLYYWPYGTYGSDFKDITTDIYGNVIVTGYVHNANSSDDYITVKYNTNGVTLWAVQYNGPGNGGDAAYSVKTDVAGNVYVTGSSYGGVSNGSDYATIKYNSSGQIQWVSRYNGTGSSTDEPVKLTLDNSGNVYVTGQSYNSSGNSDYLTVKYNSSGSQIYSSRYNGTGNGRDWPQDIKVDNSGNVYVTGASSDGFADNYATIKYNSSGSQLWVKIYNGYANGQDFGKGVAVDNSGNVYVTGWSAGYGVYNTDAVTIKYNSTGTQIWSYRYDNNNYSAFESGDNIAIDASGNIFVGGNDEGLLMLKFNSSGSLLWSKIHITDQIYRDDFIEMALDNYSNIYITGRCGNIVNDNDIITVKYNSNGVYQWRMRKNVTTNDWSRGGIALDPAGNVFIAGFLKYSSYFNVAFVTKYGSSRARFGENVIPADFLLYQNYPNPFNPTTNIKFDLPRNETVTLEIFNSLGQVVSILHDGYLEAGSHEFNWNSAGLSSGVYFYTVKAGAYTDTKKMVISK